MKNNWKSIASKVKDIDKDKEIALLKKQLASKDKLIQTLASKKESKLKIKFNKPAKAKKVLNDHIRVIIPDSHGSQINIEAASAFLADLKALNPKEVVMLGDHVDCGGWLAQHHTLGYVAETLYSYEDDIKAANDFLDQIQLNAPDAEIHYIEGNHECLTPDHEVLTSDGWLPIDKVTTEHKVASLGWGNITEYQKPTAVIKKHYDGKMFSTNSSFVDFVITPNHRVAHYKNYGVNLSYTQVQNLTSTPIHIPVSGLGKSEDYEGITDDELRVLGWIITDGSINSCLRIYQSKKDRIEQIKQLLDRTGIKYTFYYRKLRTTKPINGVSVKASKEQGVFTLLSENGSRIKDKILGLKDWHHSEKYSKVLPDYINKLSQRQIWVMLEAISDGDGHATSVKSSSIYGNFDFLTKLQALLVTNGIRALLRNKTRKGKPDHWVLYTHKASSIKFEANKLIPIEYSGDIHCLTLPNTNFFVRRNGSVHITGNSRIEKWAITQCMRNTKDADFLRKAIAPEFQLKLADRGIAYHSQGEFYDNLRIRGAIKLGKCHFWHGTSTAKQAATVNASQMGGNVVYGHTHRRDSHAASTVTGDYEAWCPGFLANIQPYWCHSRPTGWTHGYGVQLVNHTGTFLHLNIPIIDGVSFLKPLLSLGTP